MKIEVFLPSAYPIVQIVLAPNETFKAESTCFVAMSDGIQVETRMMGGQIKTYSKSLRGEDFYFNTYRAIENDGEVLLSPRFPGDVTIHTLANSSLLLQPAAFLAAQEGIKVEPIWRGGGAFAGRGLQFLRCSGNGKLIFSSYGALYVKTLKAAQRFTIDTGHLVALDEKLQPRIRQLGASTNVTLGEEQVVDLHGPGTVYLQTRSQDILMKWLQNRLG